MGTAVRPAKTSPGPWDALADVDAFVDEVLAELKAMAEDGSRPMRSGPKPPLAGATLRKAVMAIWWALVHLRLEGKTPPNPRPLSASRLAPDGFRASGRQHPVQDRHTNGRFGLLGHKSTGSQPRSDQRLVATHCRFDERPLAVSSRNLPSQASLFRDHLQVAVTLCRGTQFAAWEGRRARWDYHLNAIAVRRNRLVSGVTVIRTIGLYLGNRAVNLIEERPYLGWIVGVLIRQCLRHDHAAGRVDRQMQLAPLPARLRAMFRLQPLARSVDLQASAVDQHVQWPMRHRGRLDHRQRHRATAERGVIRGVGALQRSGG